MKFNIKKVYCNSCQSLVMGREQKVNSSTRLVCSKCGRVLRVWNGMAWRSTREGT